MKIFKIMVLLSVLWLGHCTISLGFVVNDPLNLAQNTQTALATVQSSLELIDQSKRQIEQLQLSVKNIKHLSDKDWLTVQSFMQMMYDQVRQSQDLARSMSALSELFKKQYPNYQGKKDFSSELYEWSDTVFKTFESSLYTLDIQANAIYSEQTLLENLARISQNAEGRMQALQVANLIAIEQVSQLQKFRELMMAQSNLQLAYLSHEHQQKRVQQMSIEQLIKNTRNASRPTVKHKGYGIDDIPTLTPVQY